jgi:hypothetical protein
VVVDSCEDVPLLLSSDVEENAGMSCAMSERDSSRGGKEEKEKEILGTRKEVSA